MIAIPRNGLRSAFGPRCLVCGSEGFAPFADTPPGKWVRCRACGLIRQLDPEPVSVTQRQYGFSPLHDESPESWKRAQADPHSRFKYWMVGRVLAAHGLSGRLVDVGCGSGLLQRELSLSGWTDSVGVEPSGNPAGREKLGLDIYNEPIRAFIDRPGMAGGFDVAVANHVIEHCYEPDALVEQLRELVRPGGHVLIATPNLRGAAMRWKTLASRLGLKSRPFRHLDYPKHVVLFDLGNLPRLVEAKGLRIKQVSTYTRASSDASERPRRFAIWDRLGWGDNMFVLARRPTS